ncbi:cytochrome P450 [Xylaria scruposa]|nr:cytochrome P450 [Xylaria scruposa]
MARIFQSSGIEVQFMIDQVHRLAEKASTEYFRGISALVQSGPGLWLLPVVCMLIMCFTYIVSGLRFRLSITFGGPSRVPTVPYYIPGLFHTLSLLDPAGFLVRLKNQLGSERPLLVRVCFSRIFFITNPDHVKAVFRKSKQMTNMPVSVWALRHLLNLPRRALQIYEADNSGMNSTPREGSVVAPERRLKFLIAHNLNKFLSSRYLDALNKQYLSLLVRDLHSLPIGDTWINLPDLFVFIQRINFRASIKTLAGLELLNVYPDIIEDLIIFQSYVPDMLYRMPRWLIPRAHQARKRLLGGIKRWHELGAFFGTKLVKARQIYARKIAEMTPEARAAEDLGLIFAATGNVTNSAFWFIFEACKDCELLSQLMSEVSESQFEHPRGFDIKKLTSQPLLQSVYAEVLRLYVASGVARVVRHTDIDVAGYKIPKNSYIRMYSRSMAFDHRAWLLAGRQPEKSLEEFDPNRFLVETTWKRPSHSNGGSEAPQEAPVVPMKTSDSSKMKRRFSMEGLLGLWIPYGGGDHVCPGRHFAKHEILMTFAAMLSEFDIELEHPNSKGTLPNMKYATFGALPPASKVPFRIRRRNAVALAIA